MIHEATSPDQHHDRTANDDRRGAPRQRVKARARIRDSWDSETPFWDAAIRDVSTLGMGLLLPAKLEAGQVIDIDLENAAGNWAGSMRARVVHVEETTNDHWLIGCAFISELDEPELRFFEAARVRPENATDGRRWVRFPCNVETLCYTCETVPGERHRAQILNVSAGGLGLLMPCEFSRGTLLRLEIPLGIAQPARLLLVRIVRCVEQAGRGYFLGCEFANQLGEEELRILVGD